MEHYQIRYFLAACRTLHFTRAAAEAGVSQPALTKAIQKLEDELGAPLFLRDGRMVVLTEFGKLMEEKLGRVAETRREAETAAQQFHSPTRTQLNVGLMCTIGPATQVDLLERFRLENPDIDLNLHDVTPSSGVSRLQDRKIDCAVMAMNSSTPLPVGLTSRVLYRERMVIAFGPAHRFNMAEQVTFEELRGERYIDRLHCEFSEMFLDQVHTKGLNLTYPFSSDREDWILCMIAGGMGICLLPEFMVDAPGVRTRSIVEPELERSVQIVYASGHENSHGLMALLDQADRLPWPVPGEVWRGHTSDRA